MAAMTIINNQSGRAELYRQWPYTLMFIMEGMDANKIFQDIP